ncbi:hypothetical protein Tco_0317266 [Tanacetum coccineum]
MITPRPTHFPVTTPPAGDYPLDSSDDSSNEDLSETTKTASPSTCHPPLPSKIPSLSSPPSLLPSLSRKRFGSPSPPLPSSVSPLPPPIVVPSPSEHTESIGDDIETLRANLTSAMQEIMTLHARVGSLEQHDVITLESLRIIRGRLTRSQLQAEYAKQEVREFWVTDRSEMAKL